MTLAPATPETAALTCPRRKNAYLPGTIHKRLQITAVLHGHEANEAYPMSRADRADLERSDCRRRGEDTRSFVRTVAKASCR